MISTIARHFFLASVIVLLLASSIFAVPQQTTEYKDYLKVLNETGPKEGADIQSSQNITKPVNTSSYTNPNPVTNTKPAVKNNKPKKSTTSPTKAKVIQPKVATHKDLGAFLKQYVSARGAVDYAGMLKQRKILDDYLTAMSKQAISTKSSRNNQLAYWINMYNAYTLQLILDHYPCASIRDLKAGKPWDDKFITIGSKSYSLNDIEHEIIRKQFNEPRIHFAVNCAAKSCPPLLNDAYYPSRLDAQLEQQTKVFINNPKYNKISKNNLSLSKIFEWYKGDFGDLKQYIQKYTSTDISEAKIQFKNYDWGLNSK